MIKSISLLKHYSLHNGPKRSLISDDARPYSIVYENNREFEELMLSLFLIDKYYPSESNFSLGVSRKKDFNDVKGDVEQLYAFLTNRKITIKIVPIHRCHTEQQRLVASAWGSSNRGVPCLFSGGLDSTAGALLLIKSQLAPILSHTITGNIVFGRVCKLMKNPALRDLSLIATEMRTVAADSSPVMTRGLLFLSNAMVLASSMGHRQIFVPENGPLMINPHVSPLADPTKNAHPYLLTTLERIYNQLTQAKVNIKPIFKDATKADLIRKIRGAENVINQTWSCFKIQGQARMCGICFACLVRRLSAIAAGYKEPPGTYQFDAFRIRRQALGASLITDLDILYDTLIYLEKILKDDSFVASELSMLPSNFFEDKIRLIRNFSLDMFLGIRGYLQTEGENNLGPLGRFSRKILREVPESELMLRENDLDSGSYCQR